MADHLTLHIQNLSVAALKPYANNARTHSKKQIKQIAESIQKFGFVNPALVDRDNIIIAGHGRIEAAKMLGIEQVPIIRIDHLTADEQRAYIMADNQLATLAGWDESILAIELQHLLDISFDATITGFSMPKIDLIIQNAKGASLASLLPEAAGTAPSAVISQHTPMQMKRRGIEMRLVIDNGPSRVDQTLIKALARAHAWHAEWIAGESILAIAKRENKPKTYIRSVMKLVFLAPDIIEDIVAGNHSADLMADALIKQTDLALDWGVQSNLIPTL